MDSSRGRLRLVCVWTVGKSGQKKAKVVDAVLLGAGDRPEDGVLLCLATDTKRRPDRTEKQPARHIPSAAAHVAPPSLQPAREDSATGDRFWWTSTQVRVWPFTFLHLYVRRRR
uniref:Uncharacterized protein n=1 Tax=Nymphaea colorata TaxID=210225 RepID=A0A5K1D9Z5_9MAGN